MCSRMSTIVSRSGGFSTTRFAFQVQRCARIRTAWSLQTQTPGYRQARCLGTYTNWPKQGHFRASAIRRAIFTASIAVAIGLYYVPSAYADAPPKSSAKKAIRLAEVKKHGRDAEEKWVIKGTRVYDITDWIPGHPGGEVILRAVGGTIDKYWNIFTIHKKQDVYDILEEYYIGDVDPKDLIDGKVPSDHVDDPFKSDPKRDSRLIGLSEKPCNAETAPDDLENFLTPNEVFYVRNHLWVPDVESEKYTLQIEFPDGTEKEYSINELKSKFEPVKITATLQCSGNRRKHMTEEARSTSGLQWNIGAISNAEWTGVRLRDVLADAGFAVDDYDEDEVKHAQFMGVEAYGASIPIEKAVSKHGDVLLVYEMGGKPLPPDHGFPLRVLVPGHVAARSVKWLSKIILSEDESQSQWQQRDYKCFGPNQGGQEVDWSSAPAIQETPVQSAITSLRNISYHSPADRKTLQVYGLEEDAVEVQGYAFSGGGRKIVRVDVSADEGRSWQQAEILPDDAQGHKSWAWRRWKLVLPKRLAGKVFAVKAIDEGYNVQPDSYEPHYNFRGNLTVGWHRVTYSRGI
jgi:sulfite oxidase